MKTNLSLTVRQNEPVTIVCKGETIIIHFVEKHGSVGAVLRFTASPEVKIIGDHIKKNKKRIGELAKLIQ
jgi:hypothetical protein